jgi:16S rRNA (guanine(966)-N(2))-methyltransferase RsmD
MRIIGGASRGRRLLAPKGAATRPTGDRVKQTLFDILAPRIVDCRFLDLFCGSGSIGLEAASRGAAEAVLVDQSRDAVQAAERNKEALGATGVVVVRQAVPAALQQLRGGERFDVVFLDPPYDSGLYEPVLESSGELVHDDGVVIAEHFHKRELPERIGNLVCTRSVRVGDHRLSFFQRGDRT